MIKSKIFGLVRLMRPNQWVKNFFVLSPLLFSGKFLEQNSLYSAVMATLFFCIASSSVYIVNDIHDTHSDRLHLKKSLTRPLAAGVISVSLAFTLLAMLLSILIFYWISQPDVGIVMVIYMLLNVAYSFFLKHLPVVDIFTISIGFVLRVYVGAVALNLNVSNWMFITTFCLALYLASLKRRQEIVNNGTRGRIVLENYSISLLNRYAEMSATSALIFYSMFAMSVKPELMASVPFVLFGIFRYWYVVDKLEGGESPTEVLMNDWLLSLTVLIWVGTCTYALWPYRG